MESDIETIIGDKNKIRMILALYRKGPMKKTALYEYASNNSNNARKIDDLADSYIVSLDYNRFDNNSTIVRLTPLGDQVARKLQDIEALMSGESPEPENNGDGTSAEIRDPAKP